MNAAAETTRIPPSLGGVIVFALRGWAANASFYAVLAAAVFLIDAVAEYVLPTAAESTPQGQFKLWVLAYTGLFANAFVIAAVALGVAARGIGSNLAPRTLAGAATERWLPVIAVSFLVQAVFVLTAQFSGLISPPEPLVVVSISAPIVWLLWGITGLAGPFVALAQSRTALTVLVGFGHAFTVSLRRDNFVRLCVLALITVVPLAVELWLENVLVERHVPRAYFWADIPLDVITLGPISAIQTAFALDFVRRLNPTPPENAA
ncbi:MAG TPA: hypothetical protein VHT05_01890 [Candidatus Elarobacter sp.]|nr:hypothetical protein [Candidatus Elarobacter sp.]